MEICRFRFPNHGKVDDQNSLPSLTAATQYASKQIKSIYIVSKIEKEFASWLLFRFLGMKRGLFRSAGMTVPAFGSTYDHTAEWSYARCHSGKVGLFFDSTRWFCNSWIQAKKIGLHEMKTSASTIALHTMSHSTVHSKLHFFLLDLAILWIIGAFLLKEFPWLQGIVLREIFQPGQVWAKSCRSAC